MNILILGTGAREHALAWKIAQSTRCTRLFVAPGNAGTAYVAENVAIAVHDFDAIAHWVLKNNVQLIVIGPEAPLVAGIADYFASKPSLQKIKLIGPGKAGAQLEGSKAFAKAFMQRHNIPTATYKTFQKTDFVLGLAYLKTLPLPIVLKADGLAGGKGVTICPTLPMATATLKALLIDKQFGKASTKVVVESFLQGIELSVFVLTDGKNYKILPEAKDYKRIGEGDQGPNTGGMGAVSPVAFADKTFMNKVETQIIRPTLQGLQAEKISYSGFMFIGLMHVQGEPYVIEYNVRLGDPEAEVVIPRIKTDLVDLLWATATRQLSAINLAIDDRYASTVVLASSGYPGPYEKGKTIAHVAHLKNVIPFHAGTKKDTHGRLITWGGRVMALTALDSAMHKALAKSCQAAETIQWEGMYYRKDIGKDLIFPQM